MYAGLLSAWCWVGVCMMLQACLIVVFTPAFHTYSADLLIPPDSAHEFGHTQHLPMAGSVLSTWLYCERDALSAVLPCWRAACGWRRVWWSGSHLLLCHHVRSHQSITVHVHGHTVGRCMRDRGPVFLCLSLCDLSYASDAAGVWCVRHVCSRS